MPTTVARFAATTGSALPAPPARSARRSGASAPPTGAAARFEGYTDPAETEKKILRDVFAEGDAWFGTGDLMLRDEQGYFRFVDRIGDTFRWKGENVATGEVNDAIRDCPGVLDASTYGVAVPGADGRAGMAALVVDRCFDFGMFAERLSSRLPVYALPVFVRFCRALEATETFRQKKQRLIREGFDPSLVGDPLFLRDPATGDYRPIDRAVHAGIVGGGIQDFSIGSKGRFSREMRCSMSVRSRIFSAMQQIAEEQKVTLPPLQDDLSLHETGFDSLAFAILVARLEDDLGIDPFTIAEDAAFPTTVGEFVRAYENVPA